MTKVVSDGPQSKDSEDADTCPESPQQMVVKPPDSTVVIYSSIARAVDDAQPYAGACELVDGAQMKAEQGDLVIVEIETGRMTLIAHGVRPVWYDVSPNGTQFAFATWKGMVGGNVYRNLFDLIVVERGGTTRILASGIARDWRDFVASWSPDGNWLSYIDMAGEQGGECYVVPVQGGVPRKATAQSHPSFNNFYRAAPIWDDSSQNVYLLASMSAVWKVSLGSGKASEMLRLPYERILSIIWPTMSPRSQSTKIGSKMIVSFSDSLTKQFGFYQLDLTTGLGKEIQRECKKYDIYHLVYDPELRRVVYAAEDVGSPPNFWIAEENKNPSPLTTINYGLSQYAMGRSTLVEWKSLDGQTLKGALLLPANYEEGKKYPLIVNVYAGAMGSDYLHYFGLTPISDYAPENKQLFATRGYAIFFPDVPVGIGTPMQDLIKTVLPGVNRIIDLGIANPEKLAVMGESNGGYSTLALIVQTTRFKAAAMISGFGDLVSFYGEMDPDGSSLGGLLEEPSWAARMPGSLWKYRHAYIENSPVFYLDRVQTPLLIMHGSADDNVVSFLADQVFVLLRRLGKEAVYAKYQGEGHTTLESYPNQIDFCHRLIDWFNSHLNEDQSATHVLDK
ncbi:MAG: prolyl oligopeptidase family serine peptidase [Candidatus Acidiferrales bacterium]